VPVKGMKEPLFATLFLFLAVCVLSGCESEASRDRRLKAEAKRNVAQEEEDRADAQAHQGALRAMELNKQYELDVIEHRRTGDVYSHSCRKAVAFDPSMPVSVDTKGCTPEQLRLEQEAEQKQMFEDALKNSKKTD
jgi:hypothetical protein